MMYCDYNGFFEGKSALVTGGAGFIGSHLTQHLVELGTHVRVLDNFSTGHARNVRGINATCTEGSILDQTILSEVCQDVDIVFHLAAFVSVPQSIIQPELCFKVNVEGTKNLIDTLSHLPCRRIVFASSAACYGSHPQLPSSENDEVSLESPYAESKWEGEQFIANMHGVDGVSLRFFNVFGQRQDPNSQYAAVVTAFQHAIENSQPPVIYGDGNQTRDFTPVENVVHANLLAASHPHALQGSVFNVGTGSSLSLLDLLRAMTGEHCVQVTHNEPRGGDVQHSRADITAIENVLGYSPVIEAKQALAELFNPTP